MTEQITAERALELLEHVVAKHGRDTKRGCVYVTWEDNELVPWCIVGCVFAEVGVPLSRLEGCGSNVYSLWESGSLSDVVDLSYGVASILRAAQRVQDMNETWGRALAEARRRAWALGVH